MKRHDHHSLRAVAARPAPYVMFLQAFMGLALLTLAAGASAGGGYQHAAAKKDIVDTAVHAGSFKTLVAAIKTAGLADTLKGEGPFTVFAPTDEAFAQVPPDRLAALLKDKAALTKVLTYHVVPGRVTSEQVMRLASARTVQGQSVHFETSNGVKVNGANVIRADIGASNGVIHVIDRVILPD